jgi:hypothetical protein
MSTELDATCSPCLFHFRQGEAKRARHGGNASGTLEAPMLQSMHLFWKWTTETYNIRLYSFEDEYDAVWRKEAEDHQPILTIFSSCPGRGDGHTWHIFLSRFALLPSIINRWSPFLPWLNGGCLLYARPPNTSGTPYA